MNNIFQEHINTLPEEKQNEITDDYDNKQNEYFEETNKQKLEKK